MELFNCHDELLLEEYIAKLEKTAKTLKSIFASRAITSTVSPPPSILSSIPIPNDIKHNQKLLNLWPQLKLQILEMRDCFYLLAYMFKGFVDQLRANNEKIRADAEKVRAEVEKLSPKAKQGIALLSADLKQVLSRLDQFSPYAAQMQAVMDLVSTFAKQRTEQVYAFDEKVRAYVDEHMDGGCIEWYVNQIVDLAESVRKETTTFHATFSEMCDGMVEIKKFQQPMLQEGREAADCSPNYSVAEGGDEMLESTLNRVVELMALSRL